MGFNPLKRIRKAVKNVFSGVKKVGDMIGGTVNDLVQSKLFKFAFVAAAIYFGAAYAAQGTSAFGSSSVAANSSNMMMTSAAAGTPAGIGVATDATLASIGANTATVAQGGLAGLGGGMAVGAETIAPLSGLGGPGYVSPPPAPSGLPQAPTGAPTTPGVGDTIGKDTKLNPKGFMGKSLDFMNNNPMASYGIAQVGGDLLQGAMTPNPTDEQLRYDEATRKKNRIAGFGGSGGGPVTIGNKTYN